MLRSLNPNHSIDINASSTEGISVEVRLRCACPTKDQKNSGIHSLAVYMVQPNESITSIARDLLVDKDTILDANMLSNTTQLYPFTPLLVPLNTYETCKLDPSNSDACVSPYLESYLKYAATIGGIIFIAFGPSLSLALFTIFVWLLLFCFLSSFIIHQIFLIQIVFGVLALHNVIILSRWDD